MLSPGFLGDHSFLGLARLELCKSLSLWLRASQVPGTSYLPSHISLHIFQEDPRSNFSFIDFSGGPDLVGSMVGSVTIFWNINLKYSNLCSTGVYYIYRSNIYI